MSSKNRISPAKILKSVAINGLILVAVYFVIHAYQIRNLPTDSAPKLSGTLLNGAYFSGLEGVEKPVIIHFWATWCAICDFEQESINRLSKDYSVMTIASSSGSTQDVQKFVTDGGILFPVINDEFHQIAASWGVTALPTSFIIDEKNKVRFVEVGLTTEVGLRLRLWLTEWLF